MPAFNAGRFVDVAVRSLLAERDGIDLDVIVVDDGSTDDTRDIVAAIAAEFPEVRLLANPRKGIAAARNTGVASIRPDCRFVAFLDSDDISYPGRLARQRAILAGDPAIDVLYGLMEMFSVADETGMRPDPASPTRVIRGPYLQSAMYRPSVIAAVGQFDEKFRQGCDTDFILRVVEKGYNLVLDEGIAGYYRRHDANVTLNVEEMQREFMLASMKWAARNRLGGKSGIPKVFSELFLRRDQIEEGFGE
jgi:glycosyltransferase involved in cell wall biosynthesis